MARQPLARGRLAYVAETYPSNELDQNRQPKQKNRYATLGKVTAWPAENGATMPQISLDLDALPVGMSGSTKLMIFWDDANQQDGYTGYDQQPQSYGSWQQPAPQAPQGGFNQPSQSGYQPQRTQQHPQQSRPQTPQAPQNRETGH
ncbi:hypothetical protein MSP8886_01400 [Marinomonas spartinae]|uniref:Uncharacterized protein n=1 Tax=Marinomonas spartinae TaxID=1792290 RepID=A0A1A8TB41_9GAMM|nr:hypothetical protein [Marinomonas spartinae]SBS29010.1 hypothetical protein MSP8886_01400 [Marinomonas spartinae]